MQFDVRICVYVFLTISVYSSMYIYDIHTYTSHRMYVYPICIILWYDHFLVILLLLSYVHTLYTTLF